MWLFYIRDINKNFETKNLFVREKELKSIEQKVHLKTKETLNKITSKRGEYKYSNEFYKENNINIEKIITSNAFKKVPQFFFNEKPTDNDLYIKIYGREKMQEYINGLK